MIPAALVAALALSLAPTDAPGAEPGRLAARERCLWKARDCYPPARLWYRVSVGLKAQQKRNLDKPQTETSSGETHERTTTERWTMRTNHAIRLTLLCDEVSEAETPFLDTRRINGRRKTIGGCANPGKGFRPTVRFAATAAGEVTSMARTDTFGPSESMHPAEGVRRCEGHVEREALVSSQPLAGTISTPDSQTTGLLIDAPAAAPFATIHLTTAAYTCDDNGVPFTVEAFAFDLRFNQIDVIGADPREGIFAAGTWLPLHGFLHLSPRAANFGGHYIVQKQVTQPELTGTFPAAPPGLAAITSAKDYSYTVRLEPCPDKGRDVQRC